jgi:hypothetical protein
MHKPDDRDICLVEVKRYFPSSHLKTLALEYIPSLPFTCRGVYFKPVDGQIYGNNGARDLLFNFDMSLIKKVIRTKFNTSERSFLLLSDVGNRIPIEEEGGDSTTIEIPSKHDEEQGTREVSAVQAGCDEKEGEPSRQTTPPRTLATVVVSSSSSSQRTHAFWVRKTVKPDIYDLFEHAADVNRGGDASRPPLVACVPSMTSSKFMRSVFKDLGVTDSVRMKCVLNNAFGRWQPIERVSL